MNLKSNDDNLLERISRLLPSLQRSQAKVAEFVLKHPSEVTEMRLAEIAAKTEVSEPSVIRFCASIGCSGYQDMKIVLARSLAYARSTSHSAISQSDETTDIIGKIFDYNLSSLSWVKSRLDRAQIESAVDAIIKAPQLQFFGFGASGIAAMDAQQKFPLFGRPCGAVVDSHQMIITAAMLNQEDVVIAISNTGTTREILRASKVAQDHGALVIGITGNAQSPLAERSDISLIVETLENTDLYTPTISRIAVMVVIDLLSTLTSLKLSEPQNERVQQMKRTLSDIRSTGLS